MLLNICTCRVLFFSHRENKRISALDWPLALVWVVINQLSEPYKMKTRLDWCVAGEKHDVYIYLPAHFTNTTPQSKARQKIYHLPCGVCTFAVWDGTGRCQEFKGEREEEVTKEIEIRRWNCLHRCALMKHFYYIHTHCDAHCNVGVESCWNVPQIFLFEFQSKGANYSIN